MKRVVFLIDGAADHPVPAMHGKTPLMLADLPHFNRIAREGACGTFETIPPGLPNGSATANLGVMGYDAKALFGGREGRGVLEAASIGVELRPGQIAMRVNVISLDGDRIRNHSAGHITTPEARELIEFLDKNLGIEGVKLHAGVSYRHLLILDGGDERLECAPPHDNVGGRVADLLPRAEAPEAEASARVLARVVERSRELLLDHPVNQARRAAEKCAADSLWPWAPGKKPQMPTYRELYGISGAAISAVDLIKGIAVYAGLEPIEVEGATGLWDTNYEGKAAAAMDALSRHDFVYIHVEGIDEAGHERNPWLKLKCLEWTDARIAGPLMRHAVQKGWDTTWAVLPDHFTPCNTGAHLAEPVPVAIYGPHIAPDRVERYDEDSVKMGSLGLLRGREFMDLVMGVRTHGVTRPRTRPGK